jgi:hypothetical protein
MTKVSGTPLCNTNLKLHDRLDIVEFILNTLGTDSFYAQLLRTRCTFMGRHH